jgi:hypothetical protein
MRAAFPQCLRIIVVVVWVMPSATVIIALTPADHRSLPSHPLPDRWMDQQARHQHTSAKLATNRTRLGAEAVAPAAAGRACGSGGRRPLSLSFMRRDDEAPPLASARTVHA